MARIKGKMSGLRHLISFDEAASRARRGIWKGLSVVEVEVEQSLEMVVAEEVRSSVDLPPYDRSAVDGYAVKHSDVSGATSETPVRLTVSGKSGFEENSTLPPGTCSEIYTGGRIPIGADSVVMSEYVTNSEGSVFIEKETRSWENVSRKGEDISRGSRIITKGDIIRSWHISAMIAAGLNHVKVFTKIRLGVISTGNELVPTSRSGIRNTTQPLLLNYFKRGYIETIDLGVHPDDQESIRRVISASMDGVDVLVVTGGSSIGEHDYSHDVLERMGEMVFRGVMIKPGRTISMYRIGQTPVYLVSGLPVAALTSFEALFERFMIDVLGINDCRQRIMARLTERLINSGGMRSFVRMVLSRTVDSLDATPLKQSGSGILSSLLLSNGVAELPESVEGMEEGDYIWVTLTGGAV